MKWNRTLLWAILAVGYSILIVYLSHQSQPLPQLKGWLSWDKLLHFLEYGIWVWLWWLVLRSAKIKMNLSWKILVAIGSLFAASDEWHQSFIPGRDASVLDWISDCVGILGTLFLIHKFISLRNTEQKKR